MATTYAHSAGKEFVETFRGFYHDTIQPLLKEGQYKQVHGALETTSHYINLHAQDIVFGVPFGFGLCAGILTLQDQTKNGERPSEETISKIEILLDEAF